MSRYANDEIFDLLPSFLHPLVRGLLTDTKISLSSKCAEIVKISPIKKKTVESSSIGCANQFTVAIPYAGQTLQWDVYFNQQDYTFAPDFRFPDNFMMDPDLDVIIKRVPSWHKWDATNPKALTNVIREFLSLYKEYQVRLLDSDRYRLLHNEYEMLTSSNIASSENVEMYIDNSDVVYFLVSLPVDYSALPAYVQTKTFNKLLNAGLDTATLQITFFKADPTRTKVDLSLSPRLEQILGGSAKLHIPNFPKHGALIEYVPSIDKLLKDKLDALANHYKLKNDYISTLLAMYDSNIIEYDNFEFSKCSLLFDIANKYFILHISLNQKFPDEQPKMTFGSVYSLTVDNKPITQTVDSYAYSPRWSSKMMIEKAMAEIYDKANKFL